MLGVLKPTRATLVATVLILAAIYLSQLASEAIRSMIWWYYYREVFEQVAMALAKSYGEAVQGLDIRDPTTAMGLAEFLVKSAFSYLVASIIVFYSGRPSNQGVQEDAGSAGAPDA